MNYYLCGKKHPSSMSSVTSASFNEIEGLQPKGLISLEISLKGGASNTPELIQILQSLPKSIKKLTMPWCDNSIPKSEFIDVLKSIPAWVNELIFNPEIYYACLSIDDIELLQAIPRSFKAFWNNALNIPELNDLIIVLQSFPVSIIEAALFLNNLKNLSRQELLKLFNSMPTNINRLIFEQAKNISANDMIKIFKCIPASITYLKCPMLEYNKAVYADIEQYSNTAERMIQALPSSIIDFQTYFPDNIPTDFILEVQVKLVRSLPATIKKLDIPNLFCGENKQQETQHETIMQDHQLNQKVTQAKNALQMLTWSVNKLNIKVSQFPFPCIIEMLRLMPKHISELELDFSCARNISISSFCSAINGMAPSIKKIKISQYFRDFWHPVDISANDLLSIYLAFPLTVNQFDIEYDNNPYITTYTLLECRKLISALPRSFGDTLILNAKDEHFLPHEIYIIPNVLQVIPDFISSLRLRDLCKHSDVDAIANINLLTRVIAAIQKSIIHLDLRDNNLFTLGIEGLISMLKLLPSNIRSLDLRNNNFHPVDLGHQYIGADFSAADLARILQAVPTYVTHVYMDYVDMQKIKEFVGNEDGVFDKKDANGNGLDLYYDFTKECFIKMSLNRNRLARINKICDRAIPAEILTKHLSPYLSFRDLTSVMLTLCNPTPLISNSVVFSQEQNGEEVSGKAIKRVKLS